MKKSSFATIAVVLLEIGRNESKIFMHHFFKYLIDLFLLLFILYKPETPRKE